MSIIPYQETLWSELYPGNQHTVRCLRPAVLATESVLELDERQRRRTVWRLDGGAGSDEQISWLLARGYHLVAKGLSNARAYKLAQQVGRWDAYPGYELAEVSPPVDYGRPVRMFVKRRWVDDRWRHSYYISTLSLPSKGAFLHRYDQRGAAEIEQFRQDKQGLDLAARRKHSLTGQMGYILLTDLVHNLIADFRRYGLCDSRFAQYGSKRIVRDLFTLPGRLYFHQERLVRVEVLTQNQNAQDLISCLERYCSRE